MISKKLIGSLAVAFAMPVLAGGPAAPVQSVLQCPAGTQRAGGLTSPYEASLCLKLGRDGARTFHGPYVGYFKDSGKVQAMGQFENGLRVGTWTFFDETGAKVGETNFKADEYHGARVEFFADGKVKLEESFVMGKREGARREFSPTGEINVTQFRDGHLVTASR
jgi:hypothetical protein